MTDAPETRSEPAGAAELNDGSLIAAARAWIADDPDPDTRAELQALIAGNAVDEIRERFTGRLQFGTAGIRGELGAGPGRMNRALVRKVTAGLADYLQRTLPSCAKQGVVVGRDARHLSPEFARDTAAVLAGAGIPVHLFPEPVPTPLCAFAVKDLGAAAGVMITASHNPPGDNGYKVYWENGAQIVPPHDTGISQAIDAVGSIANIPLLDADDEDGDFLREVPTAVTERYLDGLLALRIHPEVPLDLTVIYTPMHGVGLATASRAFEKAGLARFRPVPAQAAPDPDFPTVPFPNPEEPGAMDLALALAAETKADLVLANDPDADRLAVAVPAAGGAYRQLTGNEIGVLLADYLLTEGPSVRDPFVVTTVVSTALLSRMAQAHGAHYAETLTGFKWIATAAMEMKASRGYAFLIGFEEALGYSVGELVRDKDGIGAALLFAELCAFQKAQGRTVYDALDAIHARYGFHRTAQKSIVLPGSEGRARIDAAMDALRQSPPDAVGEVPVVTRSDVREGKRINVLSGVETPVDLPRSNVLVFELKDGSRILARPSGTEPKIKFYFEVVEPVPEGGSTEDAGKRAGRRLEALAAEFLTRSGFPPE
jgi:phosphomannomutase